MQVPKEYRVALMEWYEQQYILQTPGDSEYYLDSLEWKQQYYIHGHTALDLCKWIIRTIVLTPVQHFKKLRLHEVSSSKKTGK